MANEEDETKWLEKRLDAQDNLLTSLQTEMERMSELGKSNSPANLEALQNQLLELRTQAVATWEQILSRLETLSERNQLPTPTPEPLIPTPQTPPENDPGNPVVPTAPKTAQVPRKGPRVL